MTCRQLMNTNPAFCLASDSIDTVRDVMRFAQLPLLSVVEDRQQRRLLGVVREEDLARVPDDAHVRDVLDTEAPVLRADDEVEPLLGTIAAQRWPALPVVDEEGLLVGVLPLTARVERRSRAWPIAGAALAAASLGAGLMFLLDPNLGRRRRAIARDKTANWLHQGERVWEKTRRDLANRAQGLRAEVEHLMHPAEVTDAKLEARVRTRLGRLIRQPQRVQVAAHEGCVVLRGIARAQDIAKLEKGVRAIDGVRTVENQLAVAS